MTGKGPDWIIVDDPMEPTDSTKRASGETLRPSGRCGDRMPAPHSHPEFCERPAGHEGNHESERYSWWPTTKTPRVG